ncbi:MAG: universal stress protein [Methanomassiliicoccales archaeon]
MTKISKVLVGVDGSENALRAVELATHIARALGAKLTLLNVIAPSEAALFTGRSSRPLEDKTMGDERLQKAVETARRAGVEHETIVEFGHPADVIVKMAKDFDMVVVGSRGLSAVEGFLLGSVSSKVLHHSKVPALVVP